MNLRRVKAFTLCAEKKMLPFLHLHGFIYLSTISTPQTSNTRIRHLSAAINERNTAWNSCNRCDFPRSYAQTNKQLNYNRSVLSDWSRVVRTWNFSIPLWCHSNKLFNIITSLMRFNVINVERYFAVFWFIRSCHLDGLLTLLLQAKLMLWWNGDDIMNELPVKNKYRFQPLEYTRCLRG